MTPILMPQMDFGSDPEPRVRYAHENGSDSEPKQNIFEKSA